MIYCKELTDVIVGAGWAKERAPRKGPQEGQARTLGMDGSCCPQVEFLPQGICDSALKTLQLIESGPPRLARIIYLM